MVLIAYEEIFKEIDLTDELIKKEPIFLYESKDLFSKKSIRFKFKKKI